MSLSIKQQLKQLKAINNTLKQLTIVKEHLKQLIDTMSDKLPTPKPREVNSYEEEEEEEEEQDAEELVEERNEINKYLKQKYLRNLSKYSPEAVEYFQWLHAYTEKLDDQIEKIIIEKQAQRKGTHQAPKAP